MKPDCIKDINVLHSTKINAQLSVYVGQKIIHMGDSEFNRSQYMAVVIHDEKNDQSIRLKLSSLRKILTFLKKKSWLKSRRLGFFEKLKLNRQQNDVSEDMVPDHKALTEEKRRKRKLQQTEDKLERVRSGMYKDIERLHKLSDVDFDSIIGEDLRKRIKESEDRIHSMGDIIQKW